MRSWLIICATICVVYSGSVLPPVFQSWYNLTHPIVEICINETGVDADLVRSLFNKTSIPSEEHLRCLFKCIDDKLGFIRPDGSFNKEVMIAKIARLTPEIAIECLDKYESEPDGCVKSHEGTLCAMKKITLLELN
ncbi:hypothetical protein RN001_007546 [Aquatica leii]|uniref:Uncharacterized protein n=1 Tax=Aquatica leii TaxID=1421715 RepID=A0AAN7P315_9COLE|nr:hypothetical protein RN001_007546 [Aquatica leii]